VVVYVIDVMRTYILPGEQYTLYVRAKFHAVHRQASVLGQSVRFVGGYCHSFFSALVQPFAFVVRSFRDSLRSLWRLAKVVGGTSLQLAHWLVASCDRQFSVVLWNLVRSVSASVHAIVRPFFDFVSSAVRFVAALISQRNIPGLHTVVKNVVQKGDDFQNKVRIKTGMLMSPAGLTPSKVVIAKKYAPTLGKRFGHARHASQAWEQSTSSASSGSNRSSISGSDSDGGDGGDGSCTPAHSDERARHKTARAGAAQAGGAPPSSPPSPQGCTVAHRPRAATFAASGLSGANSSSLKPPATNERRIDTDVSRPSLVAFPKLTSVQSAQADFSMPTAASCSHPSPPIVSPCGNTAGGNVVA
jgi:hypothetical protein